MSRHRKIHRTKPSRFNWKVAWASMVIMGWVLVAQASIAGAQDTITLDRRVRGSTKILGTITAVSKTEVTIKTGSGEKTVPANQIARLTLADEPSELRQARQALIGGQYEQAIENLQQSELPEDAPDLVRQEWKYCLATSKAQLALRGGANAKEALAQMLDFLKTERDTYRFYPAVELLGQLAEATGANEEAVKYYQQLRKAPWPEYAVRPSILIGRAMRSQGKYQEAVGQYDEALKTTASDPATLRQQTIARIGKAASQAELGQAAESVQTLQDIIDKNDPNDQELFAEAYLALGAAYRQSQRPMDAVLAYLHIDLLFYSQQDAHAQALYHLTNLWPQLQQPDRAVEARKLLNTRYPGTIWSQKAG